jgi:predicted nuclease of restriction endonuclease-like (RecB) superfamily
MSVTIKRTVILRSIVTEKLKSELHEELQTAIKEIDARISQLEIGTRAYITDLQRSNIQQAMAVKKQVEAEKAKQTDMREELSVRDKMVQELELDKEIVRGQLESQVEVNVGDNLGELLGGVEVVTKDDIVVDIRTITPGEEDEALTVVTSLDDRA